jgi:hypothetical protein
LDDFRHFINERLTLNAPLETEEEIEVAVKFFKDSVQRAGSNPRSEHIGEFNTYQCPILMKKINEEEDSVEAGADYEPQRANDYSTQEHRNSNNCSSATKTTASKHSYTD